LRHFLDSGNIPTTCLFPRMINAGSLKAAHERGQRINSEVAGVGGSCGNASNFADQLFAAHPPRFFYGSAFGQLAKRRRASHGGNAPFSSEADLRNAAAFEFQREFQNVSARRVFELRAGIRVFDHARMARVLKMIEEFGRVHAVNCKAQKLRSFNVPRLQSENRRQGSRTLKPRNSETQG